MKTKEEIKKVISHLVTVIASRNDSSNKRRLAAIEGMLVALDKVSMNEPLPLNCVDVEVTGWLGRKTIEKRYESYRECILRLAAEVINE